MKKILIVGGVAGGATTAARLKLLVSCAGLGSRTRECSRYSARIVGSDEMQTFCL